MCVGPISARPSLSSLLRTVRLWGTASGLGRVRPYMHMREGDGAGGRRHGDGRGHVEESVDDSGSFWGWGGGGEGLFPTHECPDHLVGVKVEPTRRRRRRRRRLLSWCLPPPGVFPADKLGAPGGGTTTANSKPRLSHRIVGVREGGVVVPPTARADTKKRYSSLKIINAGCLPAQLGKNSTRADEMGGNNIQSRCQENITPVFYLASSHW